MNIRGLVGTRRFGSAGCRVRNLLSLSVAAAGMAAFSAAPVSAQCYTTGASPATYQIGVTDVGNHCDDCATAVALPFPVSFYGTTYNTVQLSSNGNLQFVAAANAAYTNDCVPSATITGPAIFPHWDDCYSVNAGFGSFSLLQGAAGSRTFTLEWRTEYFPGGGASLNFEVIFYENQSFFDVFYGSLPNGGTSATVGVQDGAGQSLQVSCNTGVASNSSLRFTYTCAAASGACCTAGNCSVGLQSACVSGGGTYRGNGSTCNPDPCNCLNYIIAPVNTQFIAGTLDSGNHCDDCLTVVPLPFPVSLYGTVYNSVQVSSNGNAQFGTPTGTFTAAYGNECLPGAAQITGPAIFPQWEDQRTDTGPGIFTRNTGTAFVIEWRTEYYAAPGTFANYELIFYPGSSFFDVVYAVLDQAGSGATVGVQSGSGAATQFECNSGGTNNNALRFSCTNQSTGGCCTNGVCSTTTQTNCVGGGGTYLGNNAVCNLCACNPLVIPGGAINEAEACGSDTNGGCNNAGAFEAISCGDVTIHGTSFSSAATRDTDWYLITMTAPGTLTATLKSEFAANLILVDDCPNLNIMAQAQTSPCGPLATVSLALGAGQWIVFVANQGFVNSPCDESGLEGRDYVLHVTADGCSPPGSCTLADGSCSVTIQANCTGTWANGGACPATGRCCVGATCAIRNSANCTFVGGTYSGDGTDCATRTGGTDFVNNTPLTINDVTSQSETIASNLGAAISYVNLTLDIAHTWVGDLIINLSYNDGNTTNAVDIINRSGYNGAGFGNGTDLSGCCYVFNDDAPGDFWVASAGNPVPTGAYKPFTQDGAGNHTVTLFATAFNGMGGTGTWTLTVSDNAAGDTGTVNVATINLNSVGPCNAGPPMARCCHPNGSCDLVVVGQCVNGVQGAPNTVCVPNTCPQPQIGACCTGPICATNVASNNCNGTFNAGNSCAITPGPPHNFCCPTNFNRDNFHDVADVFAMLGAWFVLVPGADWDGNNAFQVPDIFAFIGDWFAPC